MTQDQLRYAAVDASILLPLHQRLCDEIERANLEQVTHLENRVLPAMVWPERSGAPFDLDRWVELSDQVVAEQIQVQEELDAMVQAADVPGHDRIDWSSPKQVPNALRQRGHDVESTDEATLKALADREPLAPLVLRHRGSAKRSSTYGIEFANHVHESTNRIHPDYLQLGTATGRMSCVRPNLQNIPRDPRYRACFRPGEGRCFVKADYSQMESRIAAELSGDNRILEAYKRGDDLHAITASEMLHGKPEQN